MACTLLSSSDYSSWPKLTIFYCFRVLFRAESCSDKQKRNEGSYDTFKKNIANPLKCSSLFYIGIRKSNVIHAQLRMNCSNLNAHLHSLHVIDSPACVCSHSIEDTAHFFLYCPLYYTQRLALQNIVSRYTEFKLETLLFGRHKH